VIPAFVDIEWVLAHRPVLADVRWYLDGRSGRAAYEGGHLPGAVYVDLDEVLADPPGPDARAGRHPLPSPERFATGLGAAGIGDGDVVVGYDDAGGAIAARLVWLLRAIGQEAALLDGGLRAWPGELERGRPAAPRPPTTFTPVPWPSALLAGIEEVASTRDVMIDGRDPVRFGGGPDPVDPRSGHIPGALSVPARDHVDAEGRLLSPEVLRERFSGAGVGAGTPVVSYCGSGVVACLNLLVLEHIGLGRGRLYPGSWSQWSRDPARAVETGGS
jgi:thiosulfate/3-mercaptopyruvate sulfurtransferase